MRKWNISILAFVVGIMFVATSPVSALTINVDGNVEDWGITVANSNGSSWKPADGVAYSEGEHQFNDDQNSGQVFPGYGGQEYDAEGLYATYDESYLYLLVVTGHHEGLQWTPGDIAIAFENDITKAEFGVKTVGSEAGSVYDVSDWNDGPYSAHSASNPTTIKSGVLLGGDSQLVYKQIDTADQHYAIEAKISLSMFGAYWKNGESFIAHWTMTCGNDAVDISDPVKISTVPEPSTVLLIGVGLLGVAGLSRKARKK